MRIIRLNKLKLESDNIINTLVDLHIKTLPNSIPSTFGRFFLQKFYFNNFVNDGYIDGLIFIIDNQCVGYSIITQYGINYIQLGIKNNLIKFVYVFVFSLILSPSIIIKLYKQIIRRINSYHDKKVGNNIWLTMAIDQQKKNYKNEKGLRISIIVIDKTIELWNELFIDKIYGLVRKDNISAILLYKSYGFQVITNKDKYNNYYDVFVETINLKNRDI